MIGRGIGWGFATARDFLARRLIGLGVTPNMLTITGTLLTIATGVCLAMAVKWGGCRYSLIAAALLFGSFACDMIDGAVARIGGLASPFGAFLDSTMDRLSDFAIWAGLAFGYAWCAPANLTFVVLCMLGFFEAVMISYTKARAEDFIENCGAGYWQRGERSAAIIIAVFACNPAAFVTQQAVFPISTLVRRVLYTRAVLAGRKPVLDARGGRWWHKIQPWLYPRGSWPYDIITAVFIAWLIFAPVDPARWDILRCWLGG